MGRQSKRRKSAAHEPPAAVQPAEDSESAAATVAGSVQSPPTTLPSQPTTEESTTMTEEVADTPAMTISKELGGEPEARSGFAAEDPPYEFPDPLEPETQEEYDLLMAAAERAKARMEQERKGNVIGYCSSHSKKGFWRCGRHWTYESQPIYANEFSPEQLKRLQNEPNLKLK